MICHIFSESLSEIFLMVGGGGVLEKADAKFDLFKSSLASILLGGEMDFFGFQIFPRHLFAPKLCPAIGSTSLLCKFF